MGSPTRGKLLPRLVLLPLSMSWFLPRTLVWDPRRPASSRLWLSQPRLPRVPLRSSRTWTSSGPATGLACPRLPSCTCLRSAPSATVWSSPRCTTAAVSSTPKSWTSLTPTCSPSLPLEWPTLLPCPWPSPRPPRSPSRRPRPSRLSWPTPAPLQQLLQLPPLLLLLLLRLLPPLHQRRRARRRMMTWALASSTRLCHLLDDCRSIVNFQCDYQHSCNLELS